MFAVDSWSVPLYTRISQDAFLVADESGWRSGQSFSPGSIGYTRVGELEVEWRVVSYSAGESVDWDSVSLPHNIYENAAADQGYAAI